METFCNCGRLALMFGVLLALSSSCGTSLVSVSCMDPDIARAAVTRTQIVAFETAARMYQVDCGALPPQSTGLQALVVNPGISGWRGPYLSGRKIPLDPWGHPYRYQVLNEKPVIDSAGPDGVFGTPDDNGFGIKPRTGGSCIPTSCSSRRTRTGGDSGS
jgi:type II secretion system protein G